jgi:hypothetical protein
MIHQGDSENDTFDAQTLARLARGDFWLLSSIEGSRPNWTWR